MTSPLPGASFTELIRPHTGAITAVRATGAGHTSDVTAVVDGTAGRFFVKAVRHRPGGRLESLTREGMINPFVQPISPRVLWRADNDDWAVLGFEYVQGRHADIAPGSRDLPHLVDVLNRIAVLALPEIAADWPETRWDRYTDGPGLLRGDALLYTDVHPGNILIGDHATWAVDWAWPTRGAAWIDPALLVLQLVAAGHTAAAAESLAAGCTAWRDADPEAVDAFAVATIRMYAGAAGRNPDASWLAAMASAARVWGDHRNATRRPRR
ncbi:hypothetical protein BJF79_07360 [Actinomadura sp. CNU-125]|uniref:hypothetical protein n=1 Tax=Actinomadura sp. CNU-125 TaxID=1904961 RepID=UPI00095BADC6|nr:hypothetical protein [Actinomadura sp. CNU-125]OLT34378.1 hypothetical protein BJF79_07360 [Actinomadura sp. CNU-125]